MGKDTGIQWTDVTWNIARGCTKVDEDCKFCYMYRDSLDSTRYNPLTVVRTKTVFNLPLRIKEPSRIFTSSLTDFFHEDIDDYRDEAWDIIRRCPQHTFQILTKRPERMADHLPKDWGDGWDNVWLGASVGHPDAGERIEQLLRVKARVYFASLEPLHGPIIMSQSWTNKARFFELNTLDWVIVGGESGNQNGKYKYRECKLEWIESIVDQCKVDQVPVFVKQLGTHLAKQMGLKDRHGGDISEWPPQLMVRQFPKIFDPFLDRQSKMK